MAARLVCALFLFVMTITVYCESSSAASPLSLSLPVDKIVDSLIGAIKSLSTTIRADSVGVLARDLSILAGQEKGLALSLKTLQSSDGSIHTGSNPVEVVKILEDGLAGIRKSYIDVQEQLKAIDPAYATTHTGVLADIGAFSHDGIVAYCAPSGSCAWFAEAAQTNAFIAKLENDAQQLEDLADKLATTHQQP